MQLQRLVQTLEAIRLEASWAPILALFRVEGGDYPDRVNDENDGCPTLVRGWVESERWELERDAQRGGWDRPTPGVALD